MNLTQQQTDIIDFIVNSKKSCVTKASAGSGKTFTLAQAAKLIPPSLKSIFLAFNNTNKDDLKKAIPKYIDAVTLNSFGLSILKKHYPYLRMKVYGEEFDYQCAVFSSQLKDLDKKECFKFINRIAPLYNIARFTLSIEPDEIEALVSRKQLFYSPTDCKLVSDVIKYRINNFGNDKGQKWNSGNVNFWIDFCDQVFLPAVFNLKGEKYSIIFVDEAQDLNQCNIKCIKNSVSDDGKMVFVGDDAQAIYGFIGGDNTIFDDLVETYDTFPLTTSFRCSKNVVKFAQQYDPKIQALENAPDGSVQKRDEITPDEHDLILCRNNAPLIDVYFQLLRLNKKAHIMGKDLYGQIVTNIKESGATTCSTLNSYMDDKVIKLETFLTTELNVKSPKNTKSWKALNDIRECISILTAKCKDVKEIYTHLLRIFDEKNGTIKLSTIHKAKGDEAINVWHYQPSLIGKRDGMTVDEINLAYVAATRAKLNYYLVEGLVENTNENED